VKRLLLDLNVLLDVILDRPDAPTAAALWSAIERGQAEGYIPAHGITTIYYVLTRAKDRAFARQGLEALLTVFAVAPVDDTVLRRAVSLDWPDFEDAVCAAAAAASGCHVVVTRDPEGFPGSPVRVVDPGTALAWLKSED
jgi:predicted nucleic acid-binding protein